MQIDTQELRELIFYWIKSDEKLRTELRDIQVKILIERSVKGLSFEQMASIYKSRSKEVRVIFEAILMKIEKRISKQIANLLRQLNGKLDLDQTNKQDGHFTFSRIFLN